MFEIIKFMKRILLLVFLIPALSFSQIFTDFTNYGFTAGMVNYSSDISFLSNKTGVGFTVGGFVYHPIGGKSRLLLNLDLVSTPITFLGRRSDLDPIEEVKTRLSKIHIPILYDYLAFKKENLAIGITLGPTLSAYYDFGKFLTVSDNENYSLEPSGATITDLQKSDIRKLNTFVTTGISVQYKKLMFNLRYNYGITNPYRNYPFQSKYFEFKAKDTFFTTTVTYLLGDL